MLDFSVLLDSVPDKGAKEYSVYKPYLNYFYFLDAIVTVMFRVSVMISRYQIYILSIFRLIIVVQLSILIQFS